MSRWGCAREGGEGEVGGGLFSFFLKGSWGGGGEGIGVVDGCRSTQFNKEHSKVRKKHGARPERHSHPLSLIM